MGITETMIVQVAEVEVNDEYRVELTQLRKVTDYSPDQAEELAEMLLRRAEEARVMVAEHAQAARRRILANALSSEGVL